LHSAFLKYGNNSNCTGKIEELPTLLERPAQLTPKIHIYIYAYPHISGAFHSLWRRTNQGRTWRSFCGTESLCYGIEACGILDLESQAKAILKNMSFIEHDERKLESPLLSRYFCVRMYMHKKG
jgi:hypothetical protein